MTGIDVAMMFGKIGLIFLMVLLPFAVYSTLVERKVSAWNQNRYGPNRVGPWGLLQPLADGIKFFFKEELVPDGASPLLFKLAPALSAAPARLTIAIVPVTFPVLVEGRQFAMSIADIDVAVPFFLAMGSFAVYGILLGAWASNSRYSLLAGLRSSAQMISYELAMFLSVVTVVLLAGSMNLTEIFLAQTPNATLGQETSGLWNVFRFPVGTIAFVVFLIAAFAETNRHPFDMVERETEPVGGFHTEHSSMKFALFFIGEYAAMLTMSALITTLFFGGPSLFGLVASMESPWLRAGVGFAVFITKHAVFQFLFIWVRWTLPRFRWDQVLHLGWKVLLPVSIVNLLLAGALVVWGVY